MRTTTQIIILVKVYGFYNMKTPDCMNLCKKEVKEGDDLTL